MDHRQWSDLGQTYPPNPGPSSDKKVNARSICDRPTRCARTRRCSPRMPRARRRRAADININHHGLGRRRLPVGCTTLSKFQTGHYAACTTVCSVVMRPKFLFHFKIRATGTNRLTHTSVHTQRAAEALLFCSASRLARCGCALCSVIT